MGHRHSLAQISRYCGNRAFCLIYCDAALPHIVSDFQEMKTKLLNCVSAFLKLFPIWRFRFRRFCARHANSNKVGPIRKSMGGPKMRTHCARYFVTIQRRAKMRPHCARCFQSTATALCAFFVVCVPSRFTENAIGHFFADLLIV